MGTTDFSPYRASGVLPGSGNFSAPASTTTNSAYPGDGPFLSAGIGNDDPVDHPNSELIAIDFVDPNVDPASSPYLGLAGVRDVSFDLLPVGWPGFSGSISVAWLNMQYLTSGGTEGRSAIVSYTVAGSSLIHVSSPSGGDWIAAGAYVDNLAAPVFGVDNVRWDTYKPPTVQEQGRDWNAAARRTTCSGADPVDCATGAFNDSAVDVSIPGRGAALSQSRSYNSQGTAANGRFGYGWTDPYAMSLSIDAASGAAAVSQESGAEAGFTASGTGFDPDPGIEATLVHNLDGTYTFTRRSDHLSFGFDTSGSLTRITDSNGYVTTLGYSGGQLASVTDPAGGR
ncbi:MAG TPA: DUF6531 domain-containing protein [Jatrophihabitantaceae bacterium]|nr:DUF6531 domain-containing protein [Jatrophihabitantaceae bacterium]